MSDAKKTEKEQIWKNIEMGTERHSLLRRQSDSRSRADLQLCSQHTDLQGNVLSRAGRQDNIVFSGAKKEDADLSNLCHEFGFGGCFVSLGSGMALEVAMLSSGWRWTK